MQTLTKTTAPIDLAARAVTVYRKLAERNRQAAIAERKRQAEWADLRVSERTRRLLETVLHPASPHIDRADGPLVSAGGLWLTAQETERGWELVLVTRCETCQRAIYRDPLGDPKTSLATLGGILARMGERDTSCTFCVPSNLPYLRSFDADSEASREVGTC